MTPSLALLVCTCSTIGEGRVLTSRAQCLRLRGGGKAEQGLFGGAVWSPTDRTGVLNVVARGVGTAGFRGWTQRGGHGSGGGRAHSGRGKDAATQITPKAVESPLALTLAY